MELFRQRAEPSARRRWVGGAGEDAVALRHVAQAVQTGPALLYVSFGNRDALLEHVLDAAYGEVDLVHADGSDWRQALAATIANPIDTLVSYPGLGQVALSTVPTPPGALRLAEHELHLMDMGGISERGAGLAVDLIAQSAAATAVERTIRGVCTRTEDERTRVSTAYENTDPQLYPWLSRAAATPTGPDERSRRAFAIEAILSGIAHVDHHGRRWGLAGTDARQSCAGRVRTDTVPADESAGPRRGRPRHLTVQELRPGSDRRVGNGRQPRGT